jgi:enoyl-CoA hydratase/carnithine racemase
MSLRLERRPAGQGADFAALLTLASPEVGNALGPAMVAALENEFAAALADSARLVVLQGEGKHFCTGFDLSGLDGQSDGDLLLRFVRVELLLQAVDRSPVPTMAVARGRTFGAGADLFVACDRRYCLADARFAFPGPGFGLVLGNRRLAGRIGRDAARDILQSGRIVGAQEAVSLGLATAIVGEDEIAGRIEAEISAASRLRPETVGALRAETSTPAPEVELAALVVSASRPGLKDRIAAYAGTRKAVLAQS